MIPANDKNLVYFKWAVPEGIGGKTVYTVGYVNQQGIGATVLNEQNYSDNANTHGSTVVSKKVYADPGTNTSTSRPADFQEVSCPNASTDTVTWSQWVYENGRFEKKTYGLQINTSDFLIAPAAYIKSAVKISGKWQMPSGYGIQIDSVPVTKTASGYLTPPVDSYTYPQSFNLRLPEYSYSTNTEKMVSLSLVNGRLVYDRTRTTAAQYHFIPVWYPDVDYTLLMTVSDVWTPGGKLSGVVKSNAISIKGSMFDDYYYGK